MVVPGVGYCGCGVNNPRKAFGASSSAAVLPGASVDVDEDEEGEDEDEDEVSGDESCARAAPPSRPAVTKVDNRMRNRLYSFPGFLDVIPYRPRHPTTFSVPRPRPCSSA